MNGLKFWICLYFMHVVYGVTNNNSFQINTTCDKTTDVCETLLSANLTFNASNMSIAIPNTNLFLYFDDIILKYSVNSGLSYDLYDGQIMDNPSCSCDSNKKTPALVCNRSSKFQYTPTNLKAEVFVNANRSVCESDTLGVCCRVLFLDDIHTFRVYTRLTSRFEQIQFLYKKQAYNLSFSNNAISLLDLNFTWIGGEQWTLPADNLAILVDQDNGRLFSTLASTLNGPQEYNQSKAGWWHTNNLVQEWMQSENSTPTSRLYNLNVPRVTQTTTLEMSKLECPGLYLKSNNATNTSFYTTLVKQTFIMGIGITKMEYTTGVKGNITILSLSGVQLTLCIDYPIICICNGTNTNAIQCLDFQGFITIIDTNASRGSYGYLNGLSLYRTPICNNSDFSTYRDPHNIQVRIDSKDFIPKYRMSECQADWNIISSTNISLVSDCIFLPCTLKDDTGTTRPVNLTRTNIFFKWPNTISSINLTCGQWNEQKTYLELTLGDGNLDPIQYLVWNLLMVGFGWSAALISWAVLFTLFAIGLNNMGRNKTILLSIVLLIFLWVSGIAFVILIFGLVSLQNYRDNPSRFLRINRFSPFPPPAPKPRFFNHNHRRQEYYYEMR